MPAFFGTKFYLAAAILIVVGTVSLFSSPGDVDSAAATPAMNSGAREASVEGGARETSSDLETAKFGVLTQQFTMSAETLASMMPTNGMAESRLELCNSFIEGGMMDWKADRSTHRLRIAVRDCHNIVIGLCREAQAEDAGYCSAYKKQTAGFDYL